MSGTLSGGASEQPLSSSVSAAADLSAALVMTTFALWRSAGGDGRRCGHDLHHGAGGDAIGRVLDDAIVRCETRGDLDHRAEISLDGYRLEQHAVLRVQGGDGESLGVEDERARWHAEHMGGGCDLQVDAGVV